MRFNEKLLYFEFFHHEVYDGHLKKACDSTVFPKLFETTLFSQKSSLAQPIQIVYLLGMVKTA